jgi:3-dehydroquinate dehydratase type I
VSILPKTTNEALKLIEHAEREQADFIEARLDKLTSTEGIAELAAHGKTPKIATNKLAAAGGYFTGTENEQQRTLLAAAKNGFNYVDIDLSASNLNEFMREARENGAKIIVSHHDFNRPLKRPELTRILERELACGADVCKIVTTAKKLEDNLTILNFTATTCKKADVVCFAMGELGKVSRLLSPLFGGFLTFAALDHSGETAPGQMTIREMRTAYRLLGV